MRKRVSTFDPGKIAPTKFSGLNSKGSMFVQRVPRGQWRRQDSDVIGVPGERTRGSSWRHFLPSFTPAFDLEPVPFLLIFYYNIIATNIAKSNTFSQSRNKNPSENKFHLFSSTERWKILDIEMRFRFYAPFLSGPRVLLDIEDKIDIGKNLSSLLSVNARIWSFIVLNVSFFTFLSIYHKSIFFRKVQRHFVKQK